MTNPSVHAISERELLENMAWVQALARKLVRDPGRADDVAQAAWVRALERPPRGRTGASLSAWLARVVRSMAREDRQSEDRRQWRERAVAQDEAQPSTSDVVARSGLQQRVVAAVMELAEPERTTVLLRYMDGLSCQAIAQQRGETHGAVRKRLSRALGRLRKRLEQELGEGEEGWVRALAPLVLEGRGAKETIVLGKILGGILMSKALWTVGVGVAVVALMVTGWFFSGGARPSPRAAQAERTLGALPLAPGDDVGRAQASLPELAAPAEVESERVAVLDEAKPKGPHYMVLHPDGEPLGKVELLFCRDGAVLARGETDAEGRFAPELEEEGAAKVLAIAEAWPAQVHDVSLAPGAHDLTLHPGTVLSGQVVVDGERPVERIPLIAIADGALLDFEKELGASARDLGVSPTHWKLIPTRADDMGFFRFEGLPPGWSGDLDFPHDYQLLDRSLIESDWAPWRLHLDEHQVQLRVEVTKRLALRGRVVDIRDGEVVPIADVSLNGSIEYGSPPAFPGYIQLRTDRDGHFRLPLEDSVVEGGYLHLTTLDDRLSRRVELEPREITQDWDLGDVPIVDPKTTHSVQLILTDGLGEPIQGAVAGMNVSLPISEPSDSMGRTSLRGVVPGGAPIVLYAVGFQVQTIPVLEQVPETLKVEMEPGAGLELRLLAEDGEPLKGVRAYLSASQHPVRGGEQFPASIFGLVASGCSTYRWKQEGDSPGSLGMSARDGRVIANDLLPGLPMGLRILARSGSVLEERDILPLATGEWRILEVVLGEGSWEFRGRIVDEAGDPVHRANISRRFPPAGKTQLSSSMGVEQDGSFTIRGLFDSTVSFTASAPGYSTLSVVDLPVPTNESPVLFRLERGHDVLVRVADKAGHPVRARIYAREPNGVLGSLGRGKELELGSYLLRDLPGTQLVIDARVHGVIRPIEHNGLVPELMIEVPVLAALEATIPDALGSELDDNCLLWLFPDGETDLVRRYRVLDLKGSAPTVLSDLLPGSYLAVLRRWNRPEEISPDLDDAWFEEYPDDQFEELTPRVPVTVRAGKTTRIVIPN